jgi:hypothetical protein
MGRIIAAVIAGIVTLGIVVYAIQMVGLSLYPLPEGLDPFDTLQRDALMAHIAGQPFGAWAFAFSSELIGAFAGALVAAMIERRKALPLIVAITALALIASIMNWVSFSHPVAYMAGQVVGYPLMALLVWRLTRSPRDIPVDPDAPTIPIGDAITERREDERDDD